MKKVTQAIWDFFVAWGEYRYQVAKRRGFQYY